MMTNQQLLTIIVSLGGLILTGGLGLAGLILAQSRAMRRKMTQMESRLGSRMDRMESRLSGRIDGLESQIRELRERMARIEGTLDVIREFFVGNRRAADRSQPELLIPPRERVLSLAREETRTHRQSNRGIM